MRGYFDTAPATEVETVTHVDKGHGRLETRRHLLSAHVDWMSGSRHYPGEPRFPNLKTIGMVESTVEKAGRTSTERRFYISSAALGAERFAGAVRAHWGIENQLHWVLDVQFNEDQSRLRTGHGAKNMAVVRHFAINLVRGAGDKRSIKTRRKLAGWDTNYLHSLISPSPG
jgi:predicted transposase YbfD/YdcC